MTDSAADTRRAVRAAVADGVGVVVPCGGDGTVNTVVRELDAIGALDAVTLGVLPAGTANFFAENLGIESIGSGFEVVDAGRRRRIDVGVADGTPFVMSCIAGFPAEVSGAADAELKGRFGTLAFLVSAARSADAYEPQPVALSMETPDGDATWTGDALCLLVGNSRRFTGAGGQGDVEDGLLEVVVAESLAPFEVVREAAVHRLLDRDTEGVTRFDASVADVSFLDGSVAVSLDGELSERESLSLSVRHRTLSVLVGPDYDPQPPL